MTGGPSIAAVHRAQADALRAQADVLDTQAAVLDAGAATAPSPPSYATAARNPMGSARACRAAIRSGRYSVVMLGRTPAIAWADAEAWLADRARPATSSTPSSPATTTTPDTSTTEGRREMLRRGGVVLRAVPAPRERRASSR